MSDENAAIQSQALDSAETELDEEPFPDIPRASHLETGRKGEVIAAKYLWKKGYRILERNYRGLRGEIDIIAERRERIHFVEVKTRTTSSLGDPEDRVDSNKRDLLRQTARIYLRDFHFPPRAGTQFDVVAVMLDAKGKATSVRLISDAF
jgi:putative endonuclease